MMVESIQIWGLWRPGRLVLSHSLLSPLQPHRRYAAAIVKGDVRAIVLDIRRPGGGDHHHVRIGPTGGNVRPAAISSIAFFDKKFVAPWTVADRSTECPKK